ncbi:DUF4190 domain-containing protein [Streptomyces sp. NBC_01142]|uniref:DUF4190 domain-containing protein n=1 Tax=Streptomyces sp. NBC_01142 TaxID=2975865 RepID=UPI0022545164|nr:DUF4190 domain-containing protein [Streptomyces sp. NBC_01142]MCX4819711.1 DUF4190 domain-containing protein [Streptomyces sp. NBC_01142]
MPDNQAQPSGGPEPRDPWAPPESSSGSSGAQNKVPLDKPAATPHPHVHDQQTVTSIPGVGSGPDTGAVPPPPIAPGGPAQPAAGPYGYPAAPATPQSASGAYGPATGADPYGSGYPGYPGYQGYTQPGWQAGPANGMGITAMVLGILSVCLFCLYGVVAIVLGVLALIFGIIGRKRAQRGEATNGGMALAGIILGTIGIVIGAIVIVLIAWGITTAINEENKKDSESDYDTYSNSLVVDVTR